jgi:hypothetical protein
MQDNGHPRASVIPFSLKHRLMGEYLLRLVPAFPSGKRREHPKSAACAMVLATCRVERPRRRIMSCFLMHSWPSWKRSACSMAFPAAACGSVLGFGPSLHESDRAGLILGTVIKYGPRLIECPRYRRPMCRHAMRRCSKPALRTPTSMSPK